MLGDEVMLVQILCWENVALLLFLTTEDLSVSDINQCNVDSFAVLLSHNTRTMRNTVKANPRQTSVKVTACSQQAPLQSVANEKGSFVVQTCCYIQMPYVDRAACFGN